VADVAERYFLPAPKVKRVMDALVQVSKEALLRGEEVPMPGGVAKVIFRKPTKRWRCQGRGGALLRGKKLEEQPDLRQVRIKSPEKDISFRSNVQFEDGRFAPRQVDLDRSHRRDWKPGAPKPAMSLEPAQVKKRKGPKPPPEPEPLILPAPRDAKTLAENREAYYRRMERERASGAAQPANLNRHQVPSRTDMFRRGRQ
jgi:hypothetical protein